MGIIVFSKFFEGDLNVLLVPEISVSDQPRDRVKSQINITTIILGLHASSSHALEEGKGGECWDISYLH